MDTFNTINCVYLIYWYLVPNFGNVENLDIGTWVFNIQALISTIYATAVQFYYARRIYIVSKSIIFPIIIVGMVVSSNIIGIIVAAEQSHIKQLSERLHSTWLTSLAMWNTVAMDVLIAAVMCWSLYRKKTGFARTDSMIMTWMAYSINSGLLASLLGIAMSISFTVAPFTMYPLAFFWVLNKCYVNALLAMLNSRDYVRDRSNIDSPADNAFNLSSIRIDPPSEAYGSKFSQTVSVQRSTASDFASSRSDAFEVPKQDTTVILSQCQGQTSDVGSLHDHGGT